MTVSSWSPCHAHLLSSFLLPHTPQASDQEREVLASALAAAVATSPEAAAAAESAASDTLSRQSLASSGSLPASIGSPGRTYLSQSVTQQPQAGPLSQYYATLHSQGTQGQAQGSAGTGCGCASPGRQHASGVSSVGQQQQQASGRVWAGSGSSTLTGTGDAASADGTAAASGTAAGTIPSAAATAAQSTGVPLSGVGSNNALPHTISGATPATSFATPASGFASATSPGPLPPLLLQLLSRPPTDAAATTASLLSAANAVASASTGSGRATSGPAATLGATGSTFFRSEAVAGAGGGPTMLQQMLQQHQQATLVGGGAEGRSLLDDLSTAGLRAVLLGGASSLGAPGSTMSSAGSELPTFPTAVIRAILGLGSSAGGVSQQGSNMTATGSSSIPGHTTLTIGPTSGGGSSTFGRSFPGSPGRGPQSISSLVAALGPLSLGATGAGTRTGTLLR